MWPPGPLTAPPLSVCTNFILSLSLLSFIILLIIVNFCFVSLKMSKGRLCKLPTLACRFANFTYVYVNQLYCKTRMLYVILSGINLSNQLIFTLTLWYSWRKAISTDFFGSPSVITVDRSVIFTKKGREFTLPALLSEHFSFSLCEQYIIYIYLCWA